MLVRLIRHYHQFARPAELNWLSRVTVRVIQPIQTELRLVQGDGSVRTIGNAQACSGFDPETTTIYIADQDPILAPSFLATELNRQLDYLRLPNESELVQLMWVQPRHMERVLTSLRIRSDPQATALVQDPPGTEPASSPVEEWGEEPGSAEVVVTSPAAESPPVPVREGVENSGSATATPVVPVILTEFDPLQVRSNIPGEAHGLGASPARLTGIGTSAGAAQSSGHRTSSSSSDLVIAGDGRSHAERKPVGPAGRLVSYVLPEGLDSWYAAVGIGEDQRAILQQAAVAYVERLEQAAERPVRAASSASSGYSLESDLSGGDARYILVKALPGAWGEAGVALSYAELRAAQQLGASFWLYVVEYTHVDEAVHHTAIQDPAGRITQVRFDRGWKSIVTTEPDQASSLAPEEGRLLRTSERRGEILKVAGSGENKRLYVRWQAPLSDGPAEQWITFIPSQMQIEALTEA